MAPASDVDKIRFFFEKAPPLLRNRKRLKKFLAFLIQKEARGKRLSNLNVIFCTDQALLKINLQYLDHDFYTDVISFDLSASPKEIVGEIYVSVDRVIDNSRRFGKTIAMELHRIIFHGILHLCGYEDKTARQRQIMAKKEDSYLGLYFGRFT